MGALSAGIQTTRGWIQAVLRSSGGLDELRAELS